jgi:hypothetical protein
VVEGLHFVPESEQGFSRRPESHDRSRSHQEKY